MANRGFCNPIPLIRALGLDSTKVSSVDIHLAHGEASAVVKYYIYAGDDNQIVGEIFKTYDLIERK